MNKGKTAEAVCAALLVASGADIVAPKELKKQIAMGLRVEDNVNFQGIDAILEEVSSLDEKRNIIQAIILSHLKPTQMLTLHRTVNVGLDALLSYCQRHPEVRAKKEDIIDAIIKEM